MKDAKGHGSEPRGGSLAGNVLEGKPGYDHAVKQAAQVIGGAAGPPAELVALALANGHPKSAPVPVHPALGQFAGARSSPDTARNVRAIAQFRPRRGG